jgi:hypothetical protein
MSFSLYCMFLANFIFIYDFWIGSKYTCHKIQKMLTIIQQQAGFDPCHRYFMHMCILLKIQIVHPSMHKTLCSNPSTTHTHILSTSVEPCILFCIYSNFQTFLQFSVTVHLRWFTMFLNRLFLSSFRCIEKLHKKYSEVFLYFITIY